MTMTPLQALKAAREYVQELYCLKNDRGYPRFTGRASDVLAEEQLIAQFILDNQNGRPDA